MCTALLPCPLCSQPHFDNLESLRIGLIKAATENLICPICNNTFMGLDKLTIHLFSHCETPSSSKTQQHNDNNKTSQTESNNKKMSKYQKIHMNSEISTASEETQNMPVFNISTLPFIGVPGNVSTDSIKNQPNQNGKILSERCDICGFYFLGKNILQMHKKVIHNVQDSNVKNTHKYSCNLCNKTFKMRGSLMVHSRMVHMDNNTEGQNTKVNFKPTDIKVQIKDEINNNDSKNGINVNNQIVSANNSNTTNSNKQWECDICHKMFTTKYFLKKHKRLHTGEMPYACTKCNKTFTFQQSYHKHLLYHNDDKPHTCTNCGRSFKELSTLHNHQRIHTGEKPFSCESCGKCFRQRVSYLVHRRIHTGVMPYKCTACDKSFRYKVSQRTHKCPAQPPGTVVRQSGELVQKLIKNQSDTTNQFANVKNADVKLDFNMKTDEMFTMVQEQCFDANPNAKLEDQGKNIIDEIINDSIKKIDFEELGNFLTNSFKKNDTNQRNATDDLPSPSDKLSSLKLSSNHGSPNVQDVESNRDFNFLQENTQKGDVLRDHYNQQSMNYQDNTIFNQMYP